MNRSQLLMGPLFPCYDRTNPEIDGPKVAGNASQRLLERLSAPQRVGDDA